MHTDVIGRTFPTPKNLQEKANVGESKSKVLTLEEINNIQNAGLSVFTVYQDGGYYPKYFANDSQGIIDAQIGYIFLF